jgi:hypothetical protein
VLLGIVFWKNLFLSVWSPDRPAAYHHSLAHSYIVLMEILNFLKLGYALPHITYSCQLTVCKLIIQDLYKAILILTLQYLRHQEQKYEYINVIHIIYAVAKKHNSHGEKLLPVYLNTLLDIRR